MPSLKHTLKQHNVTLLDTENLTLQCNNCKQIWSPKLLESGRLPKGYWHCPNGCNFEPGKFKHSAEVRSYFARRNREYRQKKKAEK